MNTTTPIQTSRSSTRRPLILTILCILGFVAAAANVPTIFTDDARRVGHWFPPFLALSVVVTVICMIGLWKMHRWAVLVYTGFAVLGFALALTVGSWNLTAQLVRVAVIVIMFSQFAKMR